MRHWTRERTLTFDFDNIDLPSDPFLIIPLLSTNCLSTIGHCKFRNGKLFDIFLLVSLMSLAM